MESNAAISFGFRATRLLMAATLLACCSFHLYGQQPNAWQINDDQTLVNEISINTPVNAHVVDSVADGPSASYRLNVILP